MRGNHERVERLQLVTVPEHAGPLLVDPLLVVLYLAGRHDKLRHCTVSSGAYEPITENLLGTVHVDPD